METPQKQIPLLGTVVLAYAAGILTAVAQDPLFSEGGMLDSTVFGALIVTLILAFLFWVSAQIENPGEKDQ